MWSCAGRPLATELGVTPPKAATSLAKCFRKRWCQRGTLSSSPLALLYNTLLRPCPPAPCPPGPHPGPAEGGAGQARGAGAAGGKGPASGGNNCHCCCLPLPGSRGRTSQAMSIAELQGCVHAVRVCSARRRTAATHARRPPSAATVGLPRVAHQQPQRPWLHNPHCTRQAVTGRHARNHPHVRLVPTREAHRRWAPLLDAMPYGGRDCAPCGSFLRTAPLAAALPVVHVVRPRLPLPSRCTILCFPTALPWRALGGPGLHAQAMPAYASPPPSPLLRLAVRPCR